MESSLRYIWVLLAFMLLRGVRADCKSYGVDFSNGGSYQIDGSSNQYFSFISVFQGCNRENISPVLVSPDGNEYACSSIDTSSDGAQVTSTCGIPFSAMKSGVWKIVLESNQIAVQRSITLKIGVPETVVVTATPTIVLGITSTPQAQTVRSTITQTQTLIIVASTVTAACNGGTRTVTNYQQGQTVTVQSTVTRSLTDGQVTSYWTTTASATAVCHYPSTQNNYDGAAAPTARSSFCIGDACNLQARDQEGVNKVQERGIAGSAAVAAVTSTYTETTYTVTRTSVTTIPPRTATEVDYRTITTTIAPAPTTVCTGGGNQATVTVVMGDSGAVTQTNIVYQTTRAAGTVWVGQTQYTTFTNSASATACWRAGGWIGV
ncbi:hypothetical protein QBC33DRAFT_283050 [Phialemonium atrogriseum]|uniref:Uncharacterized protein n=1 Tax=Phialemonium atrogriseum TaxID=1093897 RepID=A0AAJ0BSR6_9PEZI|nr:uncharacterized protein QBC33DRAFT_283050 [Phialemonium atrogriseum]KAK1762352.1 hypothetical protein QBC33DRAFT_283050 [Phialemonium atrogriseum]